MAVIDLTDEVGNTDSGSNADNNKSIHIGIIANVPQELMNGIMNQPESSSSQSILDNLNQKEHTPTLYRDAIIDQLMTVLIGESHPNALLVGPAGTGKTKIVEELAHRIEVKDASVPKLLYDYTIYSLQISDIVAGSSMVGELEEKVKELIDFLSDKCNKAILFLDEFHMLFKENIYEKIAQILKPALSRGAIRVIGATTTQEVKNIDTDPAFRRRFTKVIVDELSKDQTLEIVSAYAKKLADHYKMPFNYDEKLGRNIVDIADEYCSNNMHRPDNAVTLIDRTVANAVVEKYKLLNSPDKNLQNMGRSINGVNLSKRGIIRTALKIATGHNEPKDFSEEELWSELEYIKGQDDILEQIIKILKLRNMHVRPMNSPLTFLFTGSSGVGKTEVTKIIAKYCTDEKPIKLNMAEFYSEASINRLIGAPAGYVGYDSNAEMPFDILDTNPYQVIELNEFDQAHKSVQDLFMNVFEEGYLKNNNGKIIDFSKAIIIATTNAGRMDVSNPIGLNRKKRSVSVSELSEHFKLALINRFNHKLTFHEITREIYEDIMKDTYRKEVRMIKRLKPSAALDDELSDTVLKELCNESFDVRFGARPIKTTICNYIDNRLMEG
ncbi:ATP-dependent Clp protease ATP-binding subunit [Lachnospiraceae bacterium MD335]|nr:ATP-dependent Clp protease ATP-binding subunit [Lachnospiraceae bacterium MD335]